MQKTGKSFVSLRCRKTSECVSIDGLSAFDRRLHYQQMEIVVRICVILICIVNITAMKAQLSKGNRDERKHELQKKSPKGTYDLENAILNHDESPPNLSNTFK